MYKNSDAKRDLNRRNICKHKRIGQGSFDGDESTTFELASIWPPWCWLTVWLARWYISVRASRWSRSRGGSSARALLRIPFYLEKYQFTWVNARNPPFYLEKHKEPTGSPPFYLEKHKEPTGSPPGTQGAHQEPTILLGKTPGTHQKPTILLGKTHFTWKNTRSPPFYLDKHKEPTRSPPLYLEKHKEPNLSPTGNYNNYWEVAEEKWQRWEKKIAIVQQSVLYYSVWPKGVFVSHSLPRINFKRGFAQQNFSIHAFLQATYPAVKKQQIKPNKTWQNKANQPTNQTNNQTIKQPNDQQITSQKTKQPNIQPSNQPTKRIQQTTPNQNKSNQAKPKQNKKETNQTNQPPNKSTTQQTNQPIHPPSQTNRHR